MVFWVASWLAAPGAFAAPVPTDSQLAFTAMLVAHHLELADALESSPDPRDAFVAAVLLRATMLITDASAADPAAFPRPDARIDALVSRALRDASDDPVLWWWAVVDCPASRTACDPAQGLEHLRELAPHNAATWLIEQPDATKDEVDEQLRRAARATRYDDYAGERARILANAVEELPLPEDLDTAFRDLAPDIPAAQLHLPLALSLYWSTSPPGLTWLRSRCEATGLEESLRRASLCAAAAHVLIRAEFRIARRTGLHLLAAQAASAPPALLREATLRDWEDHSRDAVGPEATATEWLTYLRRPGATEASATRELMQAHALPPFPPPGWKRPSGEIIP